MLFNENWLREWVSPELDSTALAESLTLAGHEVESLDPATPLDLSAGNRKRLQVGRIETIAPHPHEDRLKVCEVRAGGVRRLTVVCGAPNVAVGQVVPVARAGARLPGGEVRKAVIRGVESGGMLCSAAELGLAEQSSGLMELDPGALPGTPVVDHLGLDDRVFDLQLTPNRGDCLSIRGIAREVAVLTGARLRRYDPAPLRARSPETLGIVLEAPEHCARFAGRIVRGIDMHARSPDWMREKLRRAGLRPINPVVDITNLVMLESGQPMHAYDLEKLSGGIVVRLARNGERLKLLDGTTVRLKRDNLVIADHRRAVGLAGIMGGEHTAITDTTRDIFFEAAFFSPLHIQGKARRLGMHTDASHRFERGVDPTGQVAAVEMATRLLLDVAGGRPAKTCHAVSAKSLPRRRAILLARGEIPRILGTRVPSAGVQRILKRLGMEVSPGKGGWKVTPPAWRFDISGQHDLVEEVGRCHGFERIPPRMPVTSARHGAFPEAVVGMPRIRQVLTARGFHEAINYSFVDPALQQGLLESGRGVRLANPLAENLSEMRQSLLPGLLASLQRNLNRQEARVRLFETGNVFEQKGRERREHPRIAALVAGAAMPRNWGEQPRDVDFYDLKGDLTALLALTGDADRFVFEAGRHPLYHPGQSARILLAGREIGHLGQLHPVKQGMLDLEVPAFLFELDLTILEESALPRFRPLSRFPTVQRDLSVVVDRQVAAADMLLLVRETAGEHLKSLELFDIYTGEGIDKNKKSFAFRLVFQAESRSLTSGEIDTVIAEIVKALQQGVGAELRS